MKIFFDTEFLEGTQKENFPISLFRKNTPNTIDLISIGMVAEDGREYYAISKDFNLKEAWNRNDLDKNHKKNYKQKDNYWIRENVLKPIYDDLIQRFYEESSKSLRTKNYIGTFTSEDFTYKKLQYLIKKYGKTNKEIAGEVRDFIMETDIDYGVGPHQYTPVNIYAYYADYDWVAFCWLFGKMMDLPIGFPMYCKDLKQMLDEAVVVKYSHLRNSSNKGELSNEFSFNKKLSICKNSNDYPKQQNEHLAIDDARWNKKLYEFINKL